MSRKRNLLDILKNPRKSTNPDEAADFVHAVESFLSGRLSPAGSSYNDLEDSDSYENLASPTYAGSGGDMFSSMLGYDMSGADAQANQFNANESALAFRRDIYADSTKHQREVADLQAAGLNPMLATGMSGGSVQAHPASSVSPGSPAVNLGTLLSFVLQAKQLKLQEKKTDAEIENLDADTEKTKADTQAQQLYNDFFSSTANIRQILLGDEHDRNLWQKDIAQRDIAVKEAAQALAQQNAEHYNAFLDKQKEYIDALQVSEDFKRALYSANAAEARADAAYKNAMREVDKQYTEAKTDTEKEQKELLSIEARVKNGIFDEKYIQNLRSICSNQALITQLERQYKQGDYSGASRSLQKVFRDIEKQTSAGRFSYSSAYFGASQAPGASLPGQ